MSEATYSVLTNMTMEILNGISLHWTIFLIHISVVLNILQLINWKCLKISRPISTLSTVNVLNIHFPKPEVNIEVTTLWILRYLKKAYSRWQLNKMNLMWIKFLNKFAWLIYLSLVLCRLLDFIVCFMQLF